MDSSPDFQHPADGYYMIESRGNHPNARAEIIQVIDDEAIKSIVAQFKKEAAAPGFAGMLIDHEHFKHDEEQSTLAWGWLMRLEARADGIYGLIRWTRTGQAAVDGGDYRYFSTEYDMQDLDVLSETKPRRVRPLRLDGLTLTNMPNNKAGQRPITNRDMNTTNETDTQPGAALSAMGASKIAHDLTKDADSAAGHEKAAIAHRRAAKLHDDAGHEKTAEFHETLAEGHDATAESMRSVNNRASSPMAGAALNRTDEPIEISQEELDALRGKAQMLTREHAAKVGCSFADAFNTVRRAHPELFPVVIEGALDNATTRYFAEETARNARLANRRLVETEVTREVLDAQRDAVSDYKRAHGCTHDVAVNAIRNRRPDLFGLVWVSLDAAPPAPPTAAEAAARHAAVADYRARNNCSYADATNAVRNRRPDLFGIHTDADVEAPPQRAMNRVLPVHHHTGAGGRSNVWGRTHYPK